MINDTTPFWQVQEEMCRVIANSDRWLTVDLAMKALSRARQMEESRKREADMMNQKQNIAQQSGNGLAGLNSQVISGIGHTLTGGRY